eukprot:TRINITY_DN21099_c0_g1_i2.p1 TRINITY_DN21099_c0_g1~~TRINITY_DN21099_c0_g1_i2.p1  ORF type:complete len:163 (+),score=22.49 TRINITY_DN21099_c0_g1_i2:45-533(+)
MITTKMMRLPSFLLSSISNNINCTKPSAAILQANRFVVSQLKPCSTQPVGNEAKSAAAEKQAAKNETFSALMRNCKFTQMGDPVGRVVVGKIYHVVDNDIYIDFGHKLPCVCQRPRGSRENFARGSEVLVKINNLELSQKFLGHEKELTLLEADCTLLGLKN